MDALLTLLLVLAVLVVLGAGLARLARPDATADPDAALIHKPSAPNAGIRVVVHTPPPSLKNTS